MSDRQKSMKELEVVELDNEDTNDSCYTPTKPNRRAGSQKQGAAKKPGQLSLSLTSVWHRVPVELCLHYSFVCLLQFCLLITVLFVDYSLFSLQRLLQFFYWNECDTLTLYILLCNRSEEHRTNIFEKEIQCCQQSSQEGVGSRGGEIKAGILDEWNSGGVKAVCHRRGINCGSSVSTIPPGQPRSTEILLQDVECGERHS